MEKARKRLRICLLCLVTTAAVLGATYYLYDGQEQEQISEGTLITITGNQVEQLWQ